MAFSGRLLRRLRSASRFAESQHLGRGPALSATFQQVVEVVNQSSGKA